MLNRHSIVLCLGVAALLAVLAVPEGGDSGLGAAFLLALVGLLLDDGLTPWRSVAGQALQAASALLLGGLAVRQLSLGARWPLPAVELGISLTLCGVVLEMRLPFSRLKTAVALHAAGDAAFLAGLLAGLLRRDRAPNAAGWVFVGLASAVASYAAVVNLGLQISRLRDAKAGWRYRVLVAGPEGLKLRTLDGAATIPWRHVRALRRLDARHLLLVLPSPLPEELSAAGLPLEELRESEAPVAPESGAPEGYALVLHEQELGGEVASAYERLRPFVPESA